MKKIKTAVAYTLIAALTLTPLCAGSIADAASKKPALSATKKTLAKGKSATLKLKHAKKASKWKTSKKSVVKIVKSTKTNCKIKALKKGTAKISCTVKKGGKKYTPACTVKVTAAPPKTTPPAATAPAAQTETPAPEMTETPEPSPSAIPEPTKHPLADESLLENYKDLFGYVGTCATYEHYSGNASLNQLQNPEIVEHIKKHYNSFTLENEMKPDAILGGTPTLVSVDEAKKMGYTVPDTYKETEVPELHLENMEAILKFAHENGLKIRFHTFVWHSQTPDWFLSKDYNTNGGATDPATMDARLEFYIRTVMTYLMDKEKEISGEAGSIIYAWDVVNEYLHRNNANWVGVYGDMGLKPSYVKKAFEIAYDVLKSYQVTDKVVLVNNDYDTYFEVDDMKNLVAFINEGEPGKICGGIGMQSHVDIRRPTIEEYGNALEQFLNTGLEVQITELDITINFNTDGDHPTYAYKNEKETNEDQAAFVRDFMNMVIDKQLNRDKAVSPKGITGITIWGLYDNVSWRRACKPLLFGKSIDDPKPSFYEFIAAAKNRNS